MKRLRFTLVLCWLIISVKANAEPDMLLRLQVNGEGMFNETAVYFETGASYNYDPQYDAPSLGVNPGYLNIVSHLQGIDFQIKALPALNQSVSVPLKITTGASGTYQVITDGLQNLPQGACVFLYDNFAQVNWDLRNGGYTCSIADTESVARFTLHIIVSLLNGLSTAPTAPVCKASGDGLIIANVSGTGPCNYYWKDSLNNVIKTTLNSFQADTLKALNAGLYRVDVNMTGTCSSEIQYITLEGSSSPRASFQCDTVVALSQNVIFTNTSLSADSYWWDFGDGMGGAGTDEIHDYSAASVYTVSLTAFSSVCNESSVSTKSILVAGSASVDTRAIAETVQVASDIAGYFVKFNYDRAAHIEILVTDLLGRSVFRSEVPMATTEKIYLDLSKAQGQIVVVTVINTDKQERLSGRILVK